MGLSSAMVTALTGMSGAETQIDVAGNNLANSQTVGFKSSEVTFANQFLSTLSQGSGPTETNGGTNPRQIGLGTQVAGIDPNFSQGTIEISTSESDLAIQGEGFFIVEGGQGEPLFTRNGIFDTNAANELVSSTGNRLLGYGVDEFYSLQTTELVPLTIPFGTNAAQATENVNLKGNLTPTGDMADTAEVIESDVFGDSSVGRPDTSAATQSTAALPDTAGPPPTSATAAADPAGLTPGEYEYVFTFVDGWGNETLASQNPVPVTISGGNANVQLSNLPTSTDFSTLNVYRREVGVSDYRLVTDTTGSGPLTDTTADISGQPELDDTSLEGSYSYLVTFSGPGVQETRPSAPLGPQTLVNGRFYLSDLPKPTDPAYDTINVYRNVASNPNEFFLIDDIQPADLPAPTDPVNFIDGRSDAEISDSSAPDYRALDMDGPKVNKATRLVDVVKRNGLEYENLFEPGELSYTGRKGDSVLTEKTLTIDDTTTMADFLQFVEQASGIQIPAAGSSDPIPESLNTIADETGLLTPGGTTTADGQVRFVSNNGTGCAVNIPSSAFQLTRPDGTTVTPTLGFSTVQEAAGQSATSDFIAYDSLGSPLDVRLIMVLESRDGQNTTYRWFADSGGNDPSGVDHEIAVGTGLVTFDGEGNMVQANNANVNIGRNDTPASNPLDFALDFSEVSGFAAESSNISVSRQDGSTVGQLTSFAIGEGGLITGIFSNGMARNLGQIRLARFTNPSGLNQIGENLYNLGFNSGLPTEGNPGEQGLGKIVAGALELSNTDTGANLIELLLASTQYQANSRVISTSQELLDVLLNMRR